MKSRIAMKLILMWFMGVFSATSLQAEDLSLDMFLALVEENSKDLYLASLDQDLALVQEKLAKSSIRPIISGQVGYNRNVIEQTQSTAIGAAPQVNPETGLYDLYYAKVPSNYDNEMTFQVGLQQTLFDAAIINSLKASKKYTALTATVFEANRQGILTAAKKIYYQSLLLHEVYKVKKASEENAYEAYLDVQQKYSSQQVSEMDVLQAEVNWQINIPETTQAARNRDMAISNLKHMAGIGNEEDIKLMNSMSVLPDLPDTGDFGDILGKRPDYRTLQQTLSLKELNIDDARSEFIPSLTATAGFALMNYTDDALSDYDGRAFQAGIALSIPIYYGGSRFAKIEKARLERDQAKMNLMKKQDDIRSEVENLSLLLKESSSRILSAETTLRTAEKAYNIIELSSRNGLASQMDLKDSRLNLDGAQLHYFKAIYDYLDAYFSWQQANGWGDINPF